MSRKNFYRKQRIAAVRRRHEKNNHYIWLEKHLKNIFTAIETDLNAQGIKNSLNWERYNAGIISAHGDKAYGYRDYWNENNVPFFHGVAVYLLTYCQPFYEEARENEMNQEKFAVPVKLWVVQNYERFKKYLPPAKN